MAKTAKQETAHDRRLRMLIEDLCVMGLGDTVGGYNFAPARDENGRTPEDWRYNSPTLNPVNRVELMARAEEDLLDALAGLRERRKAARAEVLPFTPRRRGSKAAQGDRPLAQVIPLRRNPR